MKRILHPYNICFLGRTGNGKSSLINSLYNTSLRTDPLVSCTKTLSITTLLSDKVKGFDSISAYDTPGIGEFSSIVPYQKYYEYAVAHSHCVVLVTTLDRTDAPAQRLLISLKQHLDLRKLPKFIIAINHIDSRVTIDSKDTIVWDDNLNEPTEYRKMQIEQRIAMIQEKFEGKFLPFRVVPVCAMNGYGIDDLNKMIIE